MHFKGQVDFMPYCKRCIIDGYLIAGFLCMIYEDIQVSSEYKMRRRIFEPPPPTAQTEQARNLKFGMVGPKGDRLGMIEAIFEKLPLSRNMAKIAKF